MNKAVCFFTILAFCAGCFGADVKLDIVMKIEKALPEEAIAKPAQPRKVLVFTLATGFKHGSIPIGAKAVELLGKKTGAFETVSSDSIDVFEADSLKQFDAIVMMSTTGELFGLSGPNNDITKLKPEEREKQERLRKNLLDFVSSGKGLVGIHAATDCSYKWKEYGELIGGYFNGHPWGKINIKIDDPKSPLTAQFDGKNFEFSDEIYTYKDPYSREKLHVLLSVDIAKSGITKGENREDHDYAVAWIHDYGKGRVFSTLFGHRDETYQNPLTLKFFLTGIQYACGDIKADATPSAKLTAAK